MRHVTMVIRVMGMVVVFHVHLEKCAVKTELPPFQIVLNVTMMGMDVGSVHQGIILMINLAHVSNVINISVVQETLTIIPVLVIASDVQMIKPVVSHVSRTQHLRMGWEMGGHVFHVHLMNVVVKGTVGVGLLGNIVIHVHQA